MSAGPDFRCGPLRAQEWSGFWKANPEASLLSDEEWEAAWNSLRQWLSRRYLVDFSVKWQRHCCVDRGVPETERTLKISILVGDMLATKLLEFVQRWLQQEATLWRVAIPVDNTKDNLILIYPQGVRINPTAEADFDGFISQVRPRLAMLIEEGRKQTGVRDKPIPPLP